MRSPTAKRSSNRYIRVMLPLLPHTIVLHAVTYRNAVIQPLLHASNAACGHLPQSGHPTATYEYNALPHTCMRSPTAKRSSNRYIQWSAYRFSCSLSIPLPSMLPSFWSQPCSCRPRSRAKWLWSQAMMKTRASSSGTLGALRASNAPRVRRRLGATGQNPGHAKRSLRISMPAATT